jgi:hypothetical protein
MGKPGAADTLISTRSLRASEIEEHLRQRERLKKLGVAVLLALGLPSLCFGPFIMGCIYWLLALIWGLYVPWTWMLLGTFAVFVPLLFWTEWRTRGSFYTTTVLSTYGNSGDPSRLVTGLGDVDGLIGFVRCPRDPYVGLVELFLWGPRQVLEAMTTIRDLRRLASADRNYVAEILRGLASTDHADLKTLVAGRPGVTRMAVAYLVYYEWIGISADGSKVWIESSSRDVLKR